MDKIIHEIENKQMNSKSSFQNVKKKYLQFLRSQEVLSEPFRDKLGQLKKFYIPIGNSIYKIYENEKITK